MNDRRLRASNNGVNPAREPHYGGEGGGTPAKLLNRCCQSSLRRSEIGCGVAQALVARMLRRVPGT